ncbi:sensor histidine kinase [Puia dinghuensis]|uniref:Sensor histidine kinase n=1 Tax=Puia dinghuensis TaxID=1792502 RepID=A0A8J2XVZ3_9BACT|nr:sensor histidine kinase [Puia dinghuensis]
MLFLSLPILFSPESLPLKSYLSNPPTRRELLIYVLVLGVFYANYFLLIPAYYFTRRYLAFALFNLLCFGLLTFMPLLLAPISPLPRPGFNNTPPHTAAPNRPEYSPPPIDHPHGRPIFRDISQYLFLFLVVLFLALLLKIRDRWRHAEEEKLHAELAYLKAQINPHFLFNILNSIYALALERSDRTAGAVVKLSSMMRYVLLEAGQNRVPLEQEITYLTDYIELQQTRFEDEDTLQLDFTVTGQPEGKTIAPLLLIPFVENAFKHGINPEQPSAIRIRIDIGEKELRLAVTNRKVAPKLLPTGPAGLGINNTRQRLGILYPAQYTLSIEDNADDFHVLLTLHLT